MNQLREHWEGVSLPGDYLLERWLSGDDAAGFFETSLGSDGRRAVVKLVRASAVDSAAQLALWRRTRVLRHPNLRELLDCGRAELAGEIVIYAVFEQADDTLATALGHSPLSEAEAREVLVAVHDGALDPNHVVAVGERIKLSSDVLRAAAPDAPYHDELRTFWYKISPSTPVRSAEILTQVLGAAHTGTLSGPGRAAAAVAPIADTAVRSADPLAFEPTAAPANRFPRWILVGAAGVVLLILGLNLRRDPEAAAPSPPAPVPDRAPIVAAPPVPKASPVTETVPKPAPQPVPAGKPMWRVIAFTYRSHASAARKADQVNQRHPEFEATVFSPKEKTGYYLVSLGGRMSHEDAVRLQKKARAGGLARDVYIQNYLE
jgi:hypothetical protein